MVYYHILILAFFVGLLVKLTDQIVDEGLNCIKYSEYLFGSLYGILMAQIVVSSNSLVASLWIGLIIGVIITNKIDHLSHMLAIGSFLLYLGIIGFPALSALYLIIFTIAAALDEIIEERIKAKERLLNLLKKFVGLEMVSFIVSIITGIWTVFLSILLFDLGYIIIARITRIKPKQKLL